MPKRHLDCILSSDSKQDETNQPIASFGRLPNDVLRLIIEMTTVIKLKMFVLFSLISKQMKNVMLFFAPRVEYSFQFAHLFPPQQVYQVCMRSDYLSLTDKPITMNSVRQLEILPNLTKLRIIFCKPFSLKSLTQLKILHLIMHDNLPSDVIFPPNLIELQIHTSNSVEIPPTLDLRNHIHLQQLSISAVLCLMLPLQLKYFTLKNITINLCRLTIPNINALNLECLELIACDLLWILDLLGPNLNVSYLILQDNYYNGVPKHDVKPWTNITHLTIRKSAYIYPGTSLLVSPNHASLWFPNLKVFHYDDIDMRDTYYLQFSSFKQLLRFSSLQYLEHLSIKWPSFRDVIENGKKICEKIVSHLHFLRQIDFTWDYECCIDYGCSFFIPLKKIGTVESKSQVVTLWWKPSDI